MLLLFQYACVWNIYIIANLMSYSMQTTPYFNQKISLGQIAQNRTSLCSQQSTTPINNHISWEGTLDKQWQHETHKNNRNAPHQRRRIFDKFESKLDVKSGGKVQSDSKSKVGGELIKVKSNPHVTFQQIPDNLQPDERIEQINRQLRQHRENISSSRTMKRQNQWQKNPQEALMQWAKIQQKLTESKQILKRQEEILATKIPTFEKKIEDNNAAISEVTRLIKLKLEHENKKVDDLYHMMEKNEDRIKTREEQLSRINSELLLKESQIMRNKEINKRRELELQRIKRIEDLQNKNLQIYKQVDKKEQLSQFQDYPIDGEEWQGQPECWGEADSIQKLSKLSVNKLSTIHITDQHTHNCSGNETIGELLSPLALIDNQYML